MTAANLSPLETMRRARHGRWLEELHSDVAAALEGSAPASGVTVFLFGSRARGDWDGFSDTDLLVVGKTRAQAEEVADRLLNAGVGDDVLAISRDHWQRMVSSPSAAKRAIPAEALTRMGATSRYPLEETPPGDLFDRQDAERAIATAAAVLASADRPNQPSG